jgi:hypothetical protein
MCLIVGGRRELAPPGEPVLAHRALWLVRGIADDLDFRPGSADIEGSWRFCRKVQPSGDGDPRRMASRRCRCGAVVGARGPDAREPLPRRAADRLGDCCRLGRPRLRGQSTPGALAARPRRRLLGVERQASERGGDDQTDTYPSPAPQQELDVRLTGTNPSADRKRQPESRLVAQGAPAHLKVRPPRAPGVRTSFSNGARLSPSSSRRDWTSGPRRPDQGEAEKPRQTVRRMARKPALAQGPGGTRTSDPRGDRAGGTWRNRDVCLRPQDDPRARRRGAHE